MVFQCDNGSEFKNEVTKLLEKHNIDIRRAKTKCKHTHTAFVEASNKELTKNIRSSTEHGDHKANTQDHDEWKRCLGERI